MSERWELADVEAVIEREIAQNATQRQVAQTYALGLRSTWPTDWARVNSMILARWSRSGLLRIKRMAWDGTCFRSAELARTRNANNIALLQGVIPPRSDNAEPAPKE